jgi:plastocyanin
MWDRARMSFRRRFRPAMLLTASAMLAAGAAGGCGSSGATTSAPPTTRQGTSPKPQTSTSGSSLKVIGTPKFAVPSASDPVQSGTVQIAYRNVTARPETLRVKSGTVVKFVNYDPIQHNATSIGGPQAFRSKNFGAGGSFEVKLTHPGLVHFECTIHPATINGTIEVVG